MLLGQAVLWHDPTPRGRGQTEVEVQPRDDRLAPIAVL